jgi:hypothetical protein
VVTSLLVAYRGPKVSKVFKACTNITSINSVLLCYDNYDDLFVFIMLIQMTLFMYYANCDDPILSCLFNIVINLLT